MRPYELFIGMRYVRPRSRRGFVSFISAISMLGITIGVAVLIVVLSVMNGFEQELRERILNVVAHARVTGYDGELPQWRSVLDAALAQPEVTAAAPFVENEGLLVNGERLGGVILRGVDPQAQEAVTAIGPLMTAGTIDDLQPGEYRIVLGHGLAATLGVAPGDRVVAVISKAYVTPAGIVPRTRRFRVSGIFEAGMHEFDTRLAFVHVADGARLFGLGDAVTGVELRVRDMFDAPRLVLQFARDLGGGVYISDWTRRHTNFFRSIRITKAVMFVILSLVVAVAAFNIVSTLVLVVKDKQSDIAILRTVGATARSIMGVFVVQGTVVGIIGTLGGIVLGVAVALNVRVLVKLLEGLLQTRLVDPAVYFLGELPAKVNASDVLQISGLALALSFLSTLLPAWQAARTQPAEALRHE